MKPQTLAFAFLLYILAVLYLSVTTPISPHEAKIFFTSSDFVSYLMHWGDQLFSGFIGLRFFFIIAGFLTIFLFYCLSRGYFKKAEDANLATVIFMFLPGILTANVLANVSILVMPLILFFVLMYEKRVFWPLPLVLLGLFFIHEASVIFFVALLIFALLHKDKRLAILSSTFLIAFITLSKGISIGGGPSGHFVEIFGAYATVFSPLLFLYFFYAMYRILLREEKSLLWYISFTALAFSLLLSIRQRVNITDFAPYVMLSVILMLDIFHKSLRVRLPEFQTPYKIAFVLSLAFLVASASLIVFHKATYFMMDDPQKHFAKRIYEPYVLANRLKAKGQKCYDTPEIRLGYQLKYYGVTPCHSPQ